MRYFHQNLLGHPFSAWGQDSERFCGVEKLDRNIPQDVFWMLKIWRNIWAWSHWLGKNLLSEFLKVKLPILLSNKDCIYLSDNTIGIIRALENYFHILSSDFWESQICRKEIFLKDALISRYYLPDKHTGSKVKILTQNSKNSWISAFLAGKFKYLTQFGQIEFYGQKKF